MESESELERLRKQLDIERRERRRADMELEDMRRRFLELQERSLSPQERRLEVLRRQTAPRFILPEKEEEEEPEGYAPEEITLRLPERPAEYLEDEPVEEDWEPEELIIPEPTLLEPLYTTNFKINELLYNYTGNPVLTLKNLESYFYPFVNAIIDDNRDKFLGQKIAIVVYDREGKDTILAGKYFLEEEIGAALAYLAGLIKQYGENARTFIVTKVGLRYLEGTQRGISSVEATKKWLIISLPTKKNCWFGSVSICCNYKDNPKLLWDKAAQLNSAKGLKSRINPTNKEYADNQTYQETANYLKRTIVLRNNLHEVRTIFVPEGMDIDSSKKRGLPKIEIMVRDRHNYAMVRLKDIKALFKSKPYIGKTYDELVQIHNPLPQVESTKEAEVKVNWDKWARHLPLDDPADGNGYGDFVLKVEPSKALMQHIYNKRPNLAAKLLRDISAKDPEKGKELSTKIYPKAIFGFTPKIPKNPRSYAAYDIEAAPDSKSIFKAYAVGFAFNWLQADGNLAIEYVDFWGEDCVDQFLDYLADNIHIFKDYVLYAHNSGKFDQNILLREGLCTHQSRRKGGFSINGKKCIEVDGRWIDFNIYASGPLGGGSIIFRDSSAMLPGTLGDLTKEFNVKHKKLEDAVDHNRITLDNYHTFDALPKYLKHDCMGLLEVVNDFAGNIKGKFDIELYMCLTATSLAKQVFYKKYYWKKDQPIHTLKPNMDEFIRKGYHGGRVECMRVGAFKGKTYHFDFTGLYPYVGCDYLPYGMPQFLEIGHHNELPIQTSISQGSRKYFGFIECDVLGTKEMLNAKGCHRPLHAIEHGLELVFPYFNEPTRIILFSDEIRYGMCLGYKYKFHRMLTFQARPIMRKFFTDGFKERCAEKKKGNTTMALAWKNIINRGYGFWGLRTKDREGVVIGNKSDTDVEEYITNGQYGSHGAVGDYNIIQVAKDLKTSDVNVGIAAAISSYGRMKIHQLINDIMALGGKVYYCDTDSVITDLNLKDHPTLMQRYQEDGKGEELGSLKNECDKEVPKELIEAQRNADLANGSTKGELFFDELAVLGYKMYGLKKTLCDGTIKEIVKCGGYSQNPIFDKSIKGEPIFGEWGEYIKDGPSGGYVDNKLTFDDARKMATGEIKSLVRKQMQFKGGISSYIREGHAFAIELQDNTKRLKAKTILKLDSEGNTEPLTLPVPTAVPEVKAKTKQQLECEALQAKTKREWEERSKVLKAEYEVRAAEGEKRYQEWRAKQSQQ